MKSARVEQALELASRMQEELKALGLGAHPCVGDWVALYDAVITDSALRETTRKLFTGGHYALAVEEAYKCLNNTVKERCGSEEDGASLMRNALSPKNPRLKLSDLKTQSKRDQQQGYMEILAGCMTGIRNPRAHGHSYMDKPDVALEMLAWANHLLRLVREATRARRKRKGSGTS